MMNGVSRMDTRSRSRRQASSSKRQAASAEEKTMTKKSALAHGCTVDLAALSTEVFINYKKLEVSSNKPQASSTQVQASSVKHPKSQATSSKPQA